MTEPAANAPPMPSPVAYLTGEYPRATDTFIQREVEELRRLGIDIRTCSIRRTDPSQHTSTQQKLEAAATFHVLEATKKPASTLRAHACLVARNPGRWLRTLGLAWRTAQPGAKGMIWQAFYFAEAGVLAAHLRAIGAKWLHHHFADSSGSVAMLAAELAALPRSFTLHGPAEFFAAERWRLDEKIARARFVACISHFARSQCMLWSDPIHWDKLRIVHCGVIPEVYGPAPGRAAGDRILFVGRIAPEKGIRVLLDAFEMVSVTRGLKATLALVGDGPDRAAIEAEINDRGLSSAVKVLGYMPPDKVAEQLSQSDVLVLPSFAEGLPVVLMEALASEVAVIATRIAAVAELVEDGVSGLTVAPGDAVGLAVALERLLADPALRKAMGAEGRRKVVTEFDVRREAAWLAWLLRGAAAGVLPNGLRPDAGQEAAPSASSGKDI